MAARLKNLVIDRVDLVDKGANQLAHVVLTKRAVKKDGPTLASTHVNKPLGDERKKHKRSKMTEQGLVKRFLAMLSKEARAVPPADDSSSSSSSSSDSMSKAKDDSSSSDSSSSDSSSSSSVAKLGDEHLKYLKALHGHLDKMGDDDEKVNKFKEALGGLLAGYGDQPGADDGMGNIGGTPNAGGPQPWGREPGNRNAATKRHHLSKREVELEKRIEAAEKRAKDAEKVAKAERDARATGDMKASLRKFRGVAVDLDKDTELFKNLNESNPKAFKRVMEVLTAADEGLKSSNLFSELGSGRPDTGTSAWSRIEAEAQKLIEKSGDTKLTIHKAIDKVMKIRPDLVKEYDRERKAAAAQQ